MDDLLLMRNLILMTRILNDEVLLRGLIEDIPDPLCSICNKTPRNKKLIECIFCNKDFCFNCYGKENTQICFKCNYMIATNVNKEVLKRFSVKELRVLTDNYHVSLKDINEKEQLIEAILISFKKSIKNNQEIVDVTELKSRMEYLKTEELRDKEKKIIEEKNQAKIFSDYSQIPKETTNLEINFNNIESIDILEKDIPNLSIKKLKEFLDRFEMDYQGIIEKKELISLAQDVHRTFTRFKTNQKCIKPSEAVNKDIECNICMDNLISCVFIDCGHSMCCYKCGIQLVTCPVCRKDIKQCFKIIIG